MVGLALGSRLRPGRSSQAFRVGEFRKVYEPGPRDIEGKPPRDWHLNDHAFIRDGHGLRHMFGIAWTDADLVVHIPARAAELVRKADGRWFISSCGVGQGGLFLAPFEWFD